MIKTYVELGMGIGIVAEMAYSAEQDKSIICLEQENCTSRNVSLCSKASLRAITKINQSINYAEQSLSLVLAKRIMFISKPLDHRG